MCSDEETKTGILALKQKLIELLTQAIGQAQELGKLPAVTLPEVTVERPQNPEHGDYSSSLPLKLGRATGFSPLTIADEIAALVVELEAARQLFEKAEAVAELNAEARASYGRVVTRAEFDHALFELETAVVLARGALARIGAE